MVTSIEIICVGNELLIGKIKDTNAYFLAKQATKLGANVKRVTIIQDTIPEIAQAIREAIARKPQFIITTGGLGPTLTIKPAGSRQSLGQELEVKKLLAMVKQKCFDYAKKRGCQQILS
jgi:molybdopterin-biosynthesis enzyme MoeA-like protein